MAERLGSGEWSFEVNENWAKVPDEIVLGDCAAVGVDSKDNVYAFNRGDHPIAVFDKDGNLLRTWGEGVFTRPHGVHVAPDDEIHARGHQRSEQRDTQPDVVFTGPRVGQKADGRNGQQGHGEEHADPSHHELARCPGLDQERIGLQKTAPERRTRHKSLRLSGMLSGYWSATDADIPARNGPRPWRLRWPSRPPPNPTLDGTWGRCPPPAGSTGGPGHPWPCNPHSWAR